MVERQPRSFLSAMVYCGTLLTGLIFVPRYVCSWKAHKAVGCLLLLNIILLGVIIKRLADRKSLGSPRCQHAHISLLKPLRSGNHPELGQRGVSHLAFKILSPARICGYLTMFGHNTKIHKIGKECLDDISTGILFEKHHGVSHRICYLVLKRHDVLLNRYRLKTFSQYWP